jgi:hypothetical protein
MKRKKELGGFVTIYLVSFEWLQIKLQKFQNLLFAVR